MERETEREEEQEEEIEVQLAKREAAKEKGWSESADIVTCAGAVELGRFVSKYLSQEM